MNKHPFRNPQAGNLLISEPFLQDENFIRSVVLICEHNSDGSFGLVLNKPSILHLSELVEELAFLENEVFVGGPVEQNTLHFIYFGSQKLNGSISIAKEVWWGGAFDDLVENLRAGIIDPNSVRFFIGYSGWESGQLLDELNDSTWIVSDNIINAEVLQNTSDELWKVVLKNMGGEFKVMANYPLDPRLN